MYFQVQADHLRDALNKILSVVDRKNTRPILTYCLVSAQGDQLEIVASDLEVSAKILLSAQIDQPGKFCINAKNFFEIIRELPNEIISLDINEETNLLKLVCKEIRYSLLISKSDDFPHLNFKSVNDELALKSEDVLEFINKTSHAISHDETRLYLNGIYIQEINSKLRVVATDGHRLALMESTSVEASNPGLFNGIIIPKKGVSELKKLADSYPGEELKISVDESFIYVNAGNRYFLSVRLISRDYPKYEAVIPAKTTYTMNVDKDRLLTAVKRVKILANEKSNGIRFNLRKNALTVSANHPSLGDAVENIVVSYEGKDIDLGINAKYLIDTFSIFEDSNVSFEFNNELSPIVIKSENLKNFLGIIMPLKL